MKTPKTYRFMPPNSPILIQIARAIDPKDIGTPKVERQIEEMLAVAYGEQEEREKPILVGLAAPQIGISRRIILVDVIADGKGKIGDLRLYINPEIIGQSEEQAEWYEGCFSTSRVCGIVSRPVKIKIRAYTRNGDSVEEEYSGYTARIFQHEIDHLNGKEFVSHITDDTNLHWVEENEFPAYRNEGMWRNWSKKCPRTKWEEIKAIRPKI
jgi:peptide deformylase